MQVRAFFSPNFLLVKKEVLLLYKVSALGKLKTRFLCSRLMTFVEVLDYGVMVAQQVLVLFVWVRIPIVQL